MVQKSESLQGRKFLFGTGGRSRLYESTFSFPFIYHIRESTGRLSGVNGTVNPSLKVWAPPELPIVSGAPQSIEAVAPACFVRKGGGIGPESRRWRGLVDFFAL